jgi:hypothetical protein
MPLGTHKVEYDNKIFIIKKNDKRDYKLDKDYIKNIEYIEKYGNIISPVKVTTNGFSKKYVIRENIAGYYALIDSHIKNIPIAIIE